MKESADRTREIPQNTALESCLTNGKMLLLAAGLTVVAYLIIGVHLPTDDDWSTLLGLHAETRSLRVIAFSATSHHWQPLFYLGPGIALQFDKGGLAILPMRIINACAFFASLCALAKVGRLLGIGRLQVAFALSLFTFHEATVGVLRQWDSFGQLAGDAIARWVLVAILLPIQIRSRALRVAYLVTILPFATVLALSGTERVLGTACGTIALGFALQFLQRKEPTGRSDDGLQASSSKCSVSSYLPVLSVVAGVVVFLIVRHLAGTPIQEQSGRYTLGGGVQVLRNVAQMSFALLSPQSTLATFNCMASGDTRCMIATSLLAGIVGLAFAWQLVAQRKKTGALSFAILFAILSSFFPMALASHVSEHYLSSPSFFFALLFAVALGGMKRRWLVQSLAFVYLLMHLHGFYSKEVAAAATGRRDAADGLVLLDLVRELPPGTLIDAKRVDSGKCYSCYTCRSGNSVLEVEAARAGLRISGEASTATVRIRLLNNTTYEATPGPVRPSQPIEDSWYERVKTISSRAQSEN